MLIIFLSFLQSEINILRKIEQSSIKGPASRKRKRNFDNWQKHKHKRRKNKASNILHLRRLLYHLEKWVVLVLATNKCSEKVSGEEEHIFHSFWDLGNHVPQNTYLIQPIKLLNKKRTYTKKKNSRKGV